MNNKFIKSLFAGILTLGLVFSTFMVAFAAGDGTGNSNSVTLVEAYLTTISGNASTTGGSTIDGNSNIEANPIIKLVFNKNIIWDNTSNAITLTNWNGDLVDIDVKKLTNTNEKENIFVSPKEPLKPGKTYILKIDDTLKANNGNPLAAKYTITFTVAGIDEDLVTAQQVNDMITALPEASALTLADQTAVANARKVYSGLTVDQQKMVTNVDKLAELEKKIEVLELPQTVTDQTAAQKVDDLITALPAASAITSADKASVAEARKAYDGLTKTQKALVKNQEKLAGLESKLAELEKKATDQKSNPGNVVTDQSPTSNVNDTDKTLPKTGESSKVLTSLFGSILIAMGLIIFIMNRRGKTGKSNS
ncbi:MAG TPA: Ig-like domain-containing protein [Neobacillus sp.]|jgi:LPXTG-motif cell wall-anchored protein